MGRKKRSFTACALGMTGCHRLPTFEFRSLEKKTTDFFHISLSAGNPGFHGYKPLTQIYLLSQILNHRTLCILTEFIYENSHNLSYWLAFYSGMINLDGGSIPVYYSNVYTYLIQGTKKKHGILS